MASVNNTASAASSAADAGNVAPSAANPTFEATNNGLLPSELRDMFADDVPESFNWELFSGSAELQQPGASGSAQNCQDLQQPAANLGSAENDQDLSNVFTNMGCPEEIFDDPIVQSIGMVVLQENNQQQLDIQDQAQQDPMIWQEQNVEWQQQNLDQQQQHLYVQQQNVGQHQQLQPNDILAQAVGDELPELGGALDGILDEFLNVEQHQQQYDYGNYQQYQGQPQQQFDAQYQQQGQQLYFGQQQAQQQFEWTCDAEGLSLQPVGQDGMAQPSAEDMDAELNGIINESLNIAEARQGQHVPPMVQMVAEPSVAATIPEDILVTTAEAAIAPTIPAAAPTTFQAAVEVHAPPQQIQQTVPTTRSVAVPKRKPVSLLKPLQQRLQEQQQKVDRQQQQPVIIFNLNKANPEIVVQHLPREVQPQQQQHQVVVRPQQQQQQQHRVVLGERQHVVVEPAPKRRRLVEIPHHQHQPEPQQHQEQQRRGGKRCRNESKLQNLPEICRGVEISQKIQGKATKTLFFCVLCGNCTDRSSNAARHSIAQHLPQNQHLWQEEAMLRNVENRVYLRNLKLGWRYQVSVEVPKIRSTKMLSSIDAAAAGVDCLNGVIRLPQNFAALFPK